MLPTFSRRATHLRTLTPSLPYAKHSTPDAQNEPKRSDWQTKVSENRIGEAPGFGFRILLEAQKPAVSKTGSYIVYGQSRVYVISQQRSQENSAAGGGIGHESS